MVIRVLGILCVGVAHQSNKSTQLEIANAEALVTLVRLLRTSKKALIQVGFTVCQTGLLCVNSFSATGRRVLKNSFVIGWLIEPRCCDWLARTCNKF